MILRCSDVKKAKVGPPAFDLEYWVPARGTPFRLVLNFRVADPSRFFEGSEGLVSCSDGRRISRSVSFLANGPSRRDNLAASSIHYGWSEAK